MHSPWKSKYGFTVSDKGRIKRSLNEDERSVADMKEKILRKRLERHCLTLGDCLGEYLREICGRKAF